MADPRTLAFDLARGLQGALRERLHGVVLFGSVARGEAVPGVSDINVLVLLDVVDAAAIRAAGPMAREWAGKGNTAPLVFAVDELPRATDAFAIELSDMVDAHDLLLGDDPISGLSVDRAHLRLQAERELRGKLIQLRQGLLIAAGDGKRIGQLLLTALPSFATYHRALLRLLDERVPGTTEDVVTRAAAAIGVAPDPFLQVHAARRERRRLDPRVDDRLVDGFYELAERTAAFVDSLPETHP